MSLAWKLNRLRSMSIPEIWHRLREAALRELARGRLEGWERHGTIPGDALRTPRLFVPVDDMPVAVKVAAARSARRLLDGEFAALGRAWPRRETGDLFPASLWTLDPVGGPDWPGAESYAFDIPYRHERRRGDVKYVWEINRLQFLQPLALHAAEGDERSLAAIEAAIESWRAANPPFRGLGWASGIEVALRAISLVAVLSLVGMRLSPACRDAIAAILEASLLHLRRYPSRFSSANNHAIAEDAGIYLVCLCLPETPERLQVLEEAAAALEREAAVQIHPDGAPAEQSPTYGAFSVEFLLLAHVAGRYSARPLGPIALDRALAFAAFVEAISGPAGPPTIGDDDEGRVLTLCEPEPDYPLAVADLARRLAGGGGAISGRLRCALRTPRPAAAPRGRSFRETPSLATFARGGLSVGRIDREGTPLRLVFDHGPLGHLSLAAHGHADALAVTLEIDAMPVLVDPGTYLYHSGGAWRDWFRGTPAHNTLSLDALDQSAITGPFNWGARAVATLEAASCDGDGWRIAARHDGWRRRFGLDHLRRVETTDTGLRLVDRLVPAGQGARTARECLLAFQFAPGLVVDIDAGVARIARPGGEPFAKLAPPAGGRLALFEGAERMDGGWVSPGFGRKVAAPRLTWRGDVRPGTDLVTEIRVTPRRKEGSR